jgi:xylulokinase
MGTRTDSADDAVVLAVDLGTGGPKTALVRLDGTIVASAHERIEPTVGADGSATQEPHQWWDAVCAGATSITSAHPDAAQRVIAVAVTGQWGSTVPVDRDGTAVGDCLLWMDSRGGELARNQIGGPVEGFAPRAIIEFLRRTGGAPSLAGNDPLGHRLWILNHEPAVAARTAHFIEPLDYLNARFCGRIAASQTSMLLSWLTDNRSTGVTTYDPALVAMAGITTDQLPPLVPTGSVVGTVLDSAAATTGIPAGVPVVTALPDLLSATLGSGAIAAYEGHMAISTSSWVSCHVPGKKTSIGKQMASIPSALDDYYVLANNHDTSGVCVEWARNLLVTADDGLTTPAKASFADLDAVAATASSGSGGVLFAPWLKGERSPVADADLRGGFHGMSLSTTRADIVRSVLEGVAHNNRWLLEESESVLRHSLGELRVLGGGAVSDVWCQIHADVFGRRIHRVEAPLYTNVRGAAFFAGLCLGMLQRDQIPARVAIERTFRPDPAARAIHDGMHREFTQLHKIERKMYHRIAKLLR